MHHGELGVLLNEHFFEPLKTIFDRDCQNSRKPQFRVHGSPLHWTQLLIQYA
jgi:hypothetical protein